MKRIMARVAALTMVAFIGIVTAVLPASPASALSSCHFEQGAYQRMVNIGGQWLYATGPMIVAYGSPCRDINVMGILDGRGRHCADFMVDRIYDDPEWVRNLGYYCASDGQYAVILPYPYAYEGEFFRILYMPIGNDWNGHFQFTIAT